MSLEDNKAVVRSFWQRVNEADLGGVGELLAPDLEVDHPYITEEQRGPEVMKAIIGLFRAICPDFEFVTKAEYADAETVVTPWEANGHAAAEMEPPGSIGESVTVSGITIFTISDGQIRRISLRFESHEYYPWAEPKEDTAWERLRTDPVLEPLGGLTFLGRWKCKIRPRSCKAVAPPPEAQ
jgi:ketosteroid isomerase-like protein